MRVFLDTEFSNFRNPQLISIGLAAENGQEWYGVLEDGWTEGQCSDFVLDVVVPLLSCTAPISRAVAGSMVSSWLSSLAQEIEVVFDTETDWRLLTQLTQHSRPLGVTITGKVLTWAGSAMARRYEDVLEQILGENPERHHALIDAKAMRTAVLQTEGEFKHA